MSVQTRGHGPRCLSPAWRQRIGAKAPPDDKLRAMRERRSRIALPAGKDGAPPAVPISPPAIAPLLVLAFPRSQEKCRIVARVQFHDCEEMDTLCLGCRLHRIGSDEWRHIPSGRERRSLGHRISSAANNCAGCADGAHAGAHRHHSAERSRAEADRIGPTDNTGFLGLARENGKPHDLAREHACRSGRSCGNAAEGAGSFDRAQARAHHHHSHCRTYPRAGSSQEVTPRAECPSQTRRRHRGIRWLSLAIPGMHQRRIPPWRAGRTARGQGHGC